ncbi:MAG TPA: hypothetical protein VLV78_01385 [Thermoanaerobaculia bacterium]|nr:hypothetical protein [Thermoanaerobaculia bacterium]
MRLIACLMLIASVVAAQDDQRPRPSPAKVDPIFFELAAKSGGDIYFWAPGEFATARLQVPIHHDDVVLSYGSLQSKRRFEIPVETGVSEMTLFAGMERKDLAVLVRPDGTVAHDGDRGAEIQVFQRMLIAKITAPAAGIWKLEVDGAGAYAVTAHVKAAASGPDLDRFELVERGGRPGHEGMFPIKRPLRAGESLACQVEVSGSAREVELAFVTKDGSLIGTTELTPDGEGEYDGRCTVPKTPFRALVRGVDGSGARFQRIESHLRDVP